MDPLRLCPEPPEPGPTNLVLRISPKIPFIGQILSSALWGCYTHWDGYRTIECTENPGLCRGCVAQMPQRWKGYLHAWDSLTKKFVYVEFTPASAHQLLNQLPPRGDLRGLILKISRSGATMKGRLSVSVTPALGPTDSLPDGEDPEPVLRKLWGWKKRA